MSAKSIASNLAGLTLAEVEKLAIVDTLHACHGNKAKAARELGISEKSIYNKMKRLGIPKQPVPPPACEVEATAAHFLLGHAATTQPTASA